MHRPCKLHTILYDVFSENIHLLTSSKGAFCIRSCCVTRLAVALACCVRCGWMCQVTRQSSRDISCQNGRRLCCSDGKFIAEGFVIVVRCFAVSRSPSAKIEYPAHALGLLVGVVACRIAQVLRRAVATSAGIGRRPAAASIVLVEIGRSYNILQPDVTVWRCGLVGVIQHFREFRRHYHCLIEIAEGTIQERVLMLSDKAEQRLRFNAVLLGISIWSESVKENEVDDQIFHEEALGF